MFSSVWPVVTRGRHAGQIQAPVLGTGQGTGTGSGVGVEFQVSFSALKLVAPEPWVRPQQWREGGLELRLQDREAGSCCGAHLKSAEAGGRSQLLRSVVSGLGEGEGSSEGRAVSWWWLWW